MSERDKDEEQQAESDNDFSHDKSWECCRLRIPPDQIAYLSAILEAYDNAFLVRTEDRKTGLMRIWYVTVNRPILEEVLLDLRREIPVKVLSYSKGMDGLDQVYPE
jgi:hypothetical protein